MENVENYNKIIEKIKSEREFLKMYEYEMAEILQIDERTYSKKERGLSPFSLKEFLDVSSKLQKNPSYFLGEGNHYYFNNSPQSGNNGVNNSFNSLDNIESLKTMMQALVEKIQRLEEKNS